SRAAQPTPFPYTTLFRSNAWRGAPSKPERRQSSLAKSGNTGGRVRRTLFLPKQEPSVQPPAKRIAGGAIEQIRDGRKQRGREGRSEEHTSELQSREDLVR